MPEKLMHSPDPWAQGNVTFGPYNRPGITVVDRFGDRLVLVMAHDDAMPTVEANAALILGAPRLYRALTGLLAASTDPALDGADDDTERAAMRRLEKAEREAGAALAAVTDRRSGR